MLRIPGVCNGDPETTVLAHIRRNEFCGVGMKPPDIHGVWACSDCHDVMDMRRPERIEAEDVLRGLLRTLQALNEQGVIHG